MLFSQFQIATQLRACDLSPEEIKFCDLLIRQYSRVYPRKEITEEQELRLNALVEKYKEYLNDYDVKKVETQKAIL